MTITVLLVNYDDEAQKLYIPLLAANDITAHSAATMQEALIMLADNEYACVVINGEHFDYLPMLRVMRKITESPLCISVSSYSLEENRSACVKSIDAHLTPRGHGGQDPVPGDQRVPRAD